MQPAGQRARGLASLGRGKYVSDSGLATILSNIRVLYDVPLPASSRQSIKRSRQEELTAHPSTGELIRDVELTVAGKEHVVSIIHPISLLNHLCSSSPPFARYMKTALQKYPCTPSSPWNIILYSDEVLPGNNLKHDNKRKLQAIYWSFQQFDHQGLSMDHLWFTLAAVRSNRVKAMGGMSVVLAKVTQSFFTEPGGLHISGVNLFLEGSFHTVWAFLSTMISDADALKQALEMKGTSGMKPCVCCSNVVDFMSGLSGHDETGNLVPSSELDFSKFRLHTDQSVRDILELLRLEEDGPNLKKLQTSLGFNLVKDGLILCRELQQVYKPISSLMFDWMHVYLVNGIWNLEVGALMCKLHTHLHISHTDIHNFVSTFHWPDKKNARHVFEKRSKKTQHPLACSASEGLSVYGVLRLYLICHIYDRSPEELQAACRSYYSLCNVLDLLARISHAKPVTPAELQQAVITHLRNVRSAYGLELWIPKNHLALHLPWQMHHHGTLYSCFVHERKHKELKRYGNQLSNTACNYEKHILEQVLFTQVQDLQDEDKYPQDRCVLDNPTHAAQSICDVLAETFGVEAEGVLTSRIANVRSMRVGRGEMIVAECETHGVLVGRVEFHCYFQRDFWTCVQTYAPLGSNYFSLDNPHTIVLPTSYIGNVCTYTTIGDRILVVPP